MMTNILIAVGFSIWAFGVWFFFEDTYWLTKNTKMIRRHIEDWDSVQPSSLEEYYQRIINNELEEFQYWTRVTLKTWHPLVRKFAARRAQSTAEELETRRSNTDLS